MSLNGYAQSYKKLMQSDSLTTKFWTVEDGLPVNTVNQAVQDNDGYIWFTTYDGIVKFDGLEFKTFNHSNTPEIPHNRATEIYKQNGVGIWVSMEHEGVLLINKEGFTHFGEKEGFSKSDVTQIYEDHKHRMFFVTHDGLYTFENNKFRRFFRGKNEQQERVRILFEDIDGSKWIATNNGLIHATKDSMEEYNVSKHQPDNVFFTVFRNSEGLLLAGTSSGFFILEDGKLTSSRKFDVLKNADVYRIWEHDGITILSSYKGIFLLIDGNLKKIADPYRKENEAYHNSMVDSDGQLWMVGDRGTLSILKNWTIRDVNALSKTGLDYFISTFEDKEGNIWVTTPREGIIRIKKAQVRTIGKDEGLTEGNILGLLKDSKKRYWIGTRGGGLNMIEGDRIRHYLEHRDIKSSVVQSIAEDSLGNIWIGHYQKGLNKISEDKISEYSLGEKFDVNNVHAMYTGSDGQLWIGTYGGLIKLNPENLNQTLYTKEDGLSGSKIRYITEAEDGSIWSASLDGGVSRFKNNTFTNYTTEQGLSSDNIRSIYIDESDNNVIWVGTENNGLNRIKNDEITYISTKDGLPNYNIHWISEDDNGWLWMSSNNGVFKILKRSLNEYLDGASSSFRILVFGRNEGMRNPEGNGSIQEAGLKDSDGSFWFATQEGIAIFPNTESRVNEFKPKVIIREVVAKGESFPVDSVIFDADINDFEIDVHAITFINPEKIRFRYRMLEIDDNNEEWIELGNERRIQFSDLTPGKYIFEVQATDQAGVWLPQTSSVFIVLTPKYYQKTWFYLVCITVLVALFAGGWRIRYHRLLANQQKMKQIIEEQIEQIQREKKAVELQKEIIEKQAAKLEQSNKTKDKFFSIIAHDLRNPFQTMLGYTEYLYSDIDSFDKKEVKEGLETIKNSSQTLLNLTENLLTWANIQTGKVSPNPVDFVLHDLVQGNERLFSQSAKQKGIDLFTESDSDISLFADYNMVNTVIRNLVSNSIKFTNSGGSVSIKTECREGICSIIIADTGIGMNQELIKGVMSLDSKSTREGTNNETGTGLGLVLCKEMVEMNNGTISISSEEGKGTTFVVELPCN